MQCDRLMLMVGLSFLTLSRWLTTDYRRFMIIPMLCVTIFVILVVWFLLPRVARLMIHTPTAISIFVCLSMVQLMAVFISMRCTLCGHFLQVALTLILVVGYAIARSEERFSRNAETDLVCRLLLEKKNAPLADGDKPVTMAAYMQTTMPVFAVMKAERVAALNRMFQTQ